MTSPYLWLKVVHVLAAALWLGGAVSVLSIASQITPSLDRHRLAAMAGISNFLGTRVIAPAAGTTFLAGLCTAWVGHVGMPLWIWWGIAAAALVMIIGATALRLGFVRLVTMLEDPSTPADTVAALARRTHRFGVLVSLVLISTVVMMVLKPLF